MSNITVNNLPLQPLLFNQSDIEECTFIPVDEKESIAGIELTELTSESLRQLLLEHQCKRFKEESLRTGISMNEIVCQTLLKELKD